MFGTFWMVKENVYIYSNTKQMYCIKYFAFALSGLGLWNFFLCISLFIKFTMCFSNTALVLFPRAKSDPRLGSSLALTWKYLACPGKYIKWAAKKEMFPDFSLWASKREKSFPT